MKKRLTLLLAVLLSLVFVFVGCMPLDGYQTHTVTFVLGDGRADVVTEVSTYSELYTPDPISDEYIFGGWFTDEGLTRPHLSGKVDTDMTLYARFVKKGEKVVSFLYGNGEPDTTLVLSGAITKPVDPTREGYVFAGWYDAETGKEFIFGKAPDAAHTVISASWRPTSEGVKLIIHPENGTDIKEVTYAYSAKPSEPKAPLATSGSTAGFGGWYADPACRIPFDFSKPLTSDTHIYASWSIDFNELGNRIALEALTSTVEIITTRRSMTYGMTSTGSGVIYTDIDGYYYVITNEHVVKPYDGYPSTTYSVHDAYGNSYTAECLAYSAEYDLGVIRFRRGETELSVAKFAGCDPDVGDTLISVGSPGGLNNSVTYGTVTKYDNTVVAGGSVSFVVGQHNCPLANGSSGGPVFNVDLRLVGINFAAATDSGGNFAFGAFIQHDRVVEFLTNVNLTPELIG